jgi:uncharacterized protein involved in oxidation of intracellular sulfur
MENTTSQNILFILNDGPYGNERTYNALRLALALGKQPHTTVRVFLLGDGVACAKQGQKTPDGFYNLERMLKAVARRGEVAVCGTCREARGFAPEELIEGVLLGSMELLGDWTFAADKVIVF